MLTRQRENYYTTVLEELGGTLLAVWFFGKFTIELTSLGTSLHLVSVLIFHACRVCGLLAAVCMLVLAVGNGTFLLKRTWIVLGLGVLSALGGAQTWLLELAVLIIGLRNFDMDRVFEKLFVSLLLGTVFIIALGAAGIISADEYSRSDGTIRQTLGFYHPNVLGMRLFQICAVHLCLREKEGIRFADAAVCFLAGFFVMTAAHSRTSSLLLFGLGILTFGVMAARAEQGRNRGGRPLESLLKLCPAGALLIPAAAIFGFLWLWKYTDSSLFDETIWSRISQSGEYLREYGLSLGGRALYYQGTAARSEMGNLYTLDNGYMYLLLGFGVPAFITLLCGQALLMIKTALEKRWMLLVLLVLYMGYLMMETTPLRVDCNFFLLLLGEVLWMRRSEETEENFEYIVDRA